MRIFPRRRAVKAMADPVRASVDIATVRDRFNFDWAMSDPIDGVDTYWWWAISIRVDPAEVIADDGEGNLWSVPFTTDGEDQVTFGEPVRVRQTFVPVQAGEGVMATAVVTRRRQQVLAEQLDRPTKPDRESNPAAASAGPDNEEHPMDDTVRQALARQHGLDPDTATEDEVNAAVIAASETPEPEETPAPEAEHVETPEPVAASAAVDPEALAQLQADAAAGRQAAETLATQARDTAINAAIGEGRIAPARRAHYEAAWAADQDGTRRLLTASVDDGGLAPGLVPVGKEQGTAEASEESAAVLPWFPELAPKEA